MAFVGTTFAFTQLNQSALNLDRVASLPGGRIHDVFQSRGAQDLFGTRNKNVFAENFGANPIGVRVQFQEFLMLNGTAIQNTDLAMPEPMNINQFNTWGIARFDANMNRITTGPNALIYNTGIRWTLGQTNAADDIMVFMPTFNHITRPLGAIPAVGTQPALPAVNIPAALVGSTFAQPSSYQFADVSGRGVEGSNNNFDISTIDGVDRTTDIATQIEDAGIQTGFAAHDGSQDFWNAFTGNRNPDAACPVTSRDCRRDYRYAIIDGVLVRNEVTHFAQATLEPALGGVMSITEWNRLDRPSGNFWIFDNLAEDPQDAWFYWNGLIPANQATSLLLNDTFLPQHEDLDYIIRVNADFFTINQIPSDITPEARQIFESTPITYVIPQMAVTQTVTEVEAGATTNLEIATTESIIRRYVNGNFDTELDDANFSVRILETTTASTVTIGSPIRLTVSAAETHSVLTIEVSETRAGNVVTFPINITGALPPPPGTYHIVLNQTTATIDRCDNDLTTTFTATLYYTEAGGTQTPVSNANFAWSFTQTTANSSVTDGVVTVGTNEANSILNLAVSETRATNDTTATINTHAALTIPTTAHTIFNDPQTCLPWRVLVPNQDGNALIITEYVHGYGTTTFDNAADAYDWTGTNYHNTGTSFINFEATTLFTAMQAWYQNNNNVGSLLRNQSRNYQLNTATNLTVSTTGDARVFALTEQEVITHFDGFSRRSLIRQNVEIGRSDVTTAWWIRTQGLHATHPAQFVSYEIVSLDIYNPEEIGFNTMQHEGVGFRPAVWIQLMD